MSQRAQKRAASSASGGAADRRGLETDLREAGRLLAAGDAPAAAARLRGIVARGGLTLVELHDRAGLVVDDESPHVLS